jgi:predicted anti-sigma-YlaC factor YlaD
MDCLQFREAISARLDGEQPPLPAEALDRHLAACAGCRTWAAAAEALHRRVRVTAASDAPDLSAAILAAARPSHAHHPAERSARWGLVLVAAVQLLAAIPAVLGGSGAEGVHAARELGAWDAALAAGFLLAAWQPRRALGMLPLVAVVVALLTVTSVLDLAEGHAAATGEAVHVLAVAGLALLWTVAGRPRPTRPNRVRLA